MLRTMKMAGILATLATGLAHGPARATSQSESTKQRESRTEVQAAPVPKAEAPVARRQGRVAPPPRNLAPARPCGDCFVSFLEKEKQFMSTTFCGPLLLKFSARCCHPWGCITCSSDIPQFIEGAASPKRIEATDFFSIPDRIITGPAAEVEIKYLDSNGQTRSLRISNSSDVNVGDVQMKILQEGQVKEPVSMEIRCGSAFTQPDGQR